MKKLLTIAAASVALAAGCGGGASNGTTQPVKTVTVTKPMPAYQANLILSTANVDLAQTVFLHVMGYVSAKDVSDSQTVAITMQHLYGKYADAIHNTRISREIAKAGKS